MHRLVSALFMSALLALGAGVRAEAQTWATRFEAQFGKPSGPAAAALAALDRLGAPMPAEVATFRAFASRAVVSPSSVALLVPRELSGLKAGVDGWQVKTVVAATPGRALLQNGAALALAFEVVSRRDEEPRNITSSFATPFFGTVVSIRLRLLSVLGGRPLGTREWKDQANAITKDKLDGELTRVLTPSLAQNAVEVMKGRAPQAMVLRFRIVSAGDADSLEWATAGEASVSVPLDSEPGTFEGRLRGGLPAFLAAAADTGRYTVTHLDPLTFTRK